MHFFSNEPTSPDALRLRHYIASPQSQNCSEERGSGAAGRRDSIFFLLEAVLTSFHKKPRESPIFLRLALPRHFVNVIEPRLPSLPPETAVLSRLLFHMLICPDVIRQAIMRPRRSKSSYHEEEKKETVPCPVGCCQAPSQFPPGREKNLAALERNFRCPFAMRSPLPLSTQPRSFENFRSKLSSYMASASIHVWYTGSIEGIRFKPQTCGLSIYFADMILRFL